MITQTVLEIFLTVFEILFSVFPSFPAMPEVITTGFSWFISFTNNGIGLVVYFLGVPLYYAVMSLILFMTLFEYIQMFVIRFLIFRLFMGFVGR